MAPDTLAWMERSDPAQEDSAEWLFRTRHFHVGYRPLVGLSFLFNLWVGGPDSASVRLTDLILHLGVAWLLMRLFRVLAPELPRWGAVLAAGIYLAHPSIEEVVPFSARRGYTMSALFGLLATCWACRSARGPGAVGRRAAASQLTGIAFVLGLYSNEVTVMTVGALPFLLWWCEEPGPRRVRHVLAGCLGPAIWIGAALLVRFQLVGGVGGYAVEGEEEAAPLAIVQALWHGLVGLGFVGRKSALFATPVFLAGLGAVVAVLFASCARLRRVGGGGAHVGPVIALSIWLLAFSPVYAGQGVWFRRMVYPLTVPWALLFAVVLAATWASGRRGRTMFATQVAVLVGTLAVSSPVLHGPSPRRVDKWRLNQSLLDGLAEAVETVEIPAIMWLVLPYYPRAEQDRTRQLHDQHLSEPVSRTLRMPFRWVKYLHRNEDIKFVEFLYVLERGKTWTAELEVVGKGNKVAVQMPEGREFERVASREKSPSPDQRHVQLLGLSTAERTFHVYVYLYGSDGGELVRVNGPQ